MKKLLSLTLLSSVLFFQGSFSGNGFLFADGPADQNAKSQEKKDLPDDMKERLQKLIAELDAPRWKKRDAAERELLDLVRCNPAVPSWLEKRKRAGLTPQQVVSVNEALSVDDRRAERFIDLMLFEKTRFVEKEHAFELKQTLEREVASLPPGSNARKAVVEKLFRIALDDQYLSEDRADAARILGKFGQEGFDKLVFIYKSSSPEWLRSLAFDLIVETKDRRAIDFYIESIKKGERVDIAANYLPALGPEASRAVPTLIDAFQKTEKYGRSLIWSMGRFSHPQVLPFLTEQLMKKTKDYEFQQEAAYSLGELGAFDVLKKALQSSDNYTTQASSFRVLASYKPALAFSTLKEMVEKNKNTEFRKYAREFHTVLLNSIWTRDGDRWHEISPILKTTFAESDEQLQITFIDIVKGTTGPLSLEAQKALQSLLPVTKSKAIQAEILSLIEKKIRNEQDANNGNSNE